jgi:hypothetical protein
LRSLSDGGGWWASSSSHSDRGRSSNGGRAVRFASSRRRRKGRRREAGGGRDVLVIIVVFEPGGRWGYYDRDMGRGSRVVVLSSSSVVGGTWEAGGGRRRCKEGKTFPSHSYPRPFPVFGIDPIFLFSSLIFVLSYHYTAQTSYTALSPSTVCHRCA